MTGLTLRCLMPMICFTASLMSQDGDHAKTSVSTSVVRAKAILGVESISNNASGSLSIQGDALVFQSSAGSSVRIPIASIQRVVVSEEDKQVGGVPLALGRAATPFGGGRVIGLLAHKKYDYLTLEYLDSNGGFHGAIWQLNKGQGQPLGTELEAKGVHFGGLKDHATVDTGAKNETN